MNFKTISIAMLALTVAVSSCKDSDPEEIIVTQTVSTGNVVVTSNITTNTTWEKENVYQLAGRITVTDGVTLTIEAGTIIKGEAGTGANATALLVARGGTLMAEGTATSPIIFTSVADELSPADITAGNFGSPNLDPDIAGLWGGLIVLGKAPISASNASGDVAQVQIEGIPTSDANGLYGGSNPADNSGVLKYISIRHGGSNIGAGNEINGLTLGGVGSGTTIENIEVVSNADDGIEWFGGTVNVTNALTWNCNDDGMDTDQAWSGTLDNFVVVAPTGHGMELDGPEGSASGSHTMKNGLIVASLAGRQMEDLINVDNNSEVSLENIHITGILTGQQINRVTAPLVSFTGITLDVPAADVPSHVNGTVPAGITAGGSTSAQADLSKFTWTWAAQSGSL